MTLLVGGVQTFDGRGDANSLCQRWERWFRACELYMGASGVTDDKQKRQVSLHCAGTDVLDICYTLPNTGETYTAAKEKITAYFTSRKNTSYNFHSAKTVKQKGKVWRNS